ncbi:adenylyltransferase/cytidyltransferase family protein [Sporofaciens sp. JLR.KK001]|uniref:adenylyltransferase/cytidyltransferase family protein n=1 Tax=Sporofaciens sp. JLR.KK001 TaxID=3112621 RepID=UPI002FEF11F6
MEQAQEIVKGIQSGLLQWYDFKPDSMILYIGGEEDAIAEMLRERAEVLICVSCETAGEERWRQTYRERFDYIISVVALERQLHPERILAGLRKLLKADGKLLLGMNNRLGTKYFCGDRDPYTGRNFDGVEGYRRAYAKKEDTFQGRMYSQAELKAMLQAAGWEECRFYAVLSDLENPTLIYAQDFLPNEDLSGRLFPTYHYPNSVFLEEECLYTDLIANGMFHQMANAYLIECALDGCFSDVSHVTGSMERGRKRAIFTVIHKSGIVEKRAAYPEGRARLEKMVEYGEDLKAHGVPTVDAKMEKGAYVMPYIEGETGHAYLKRLLLEDVDMFLQKFDQFRDLILQSSEIVKADSGDGEGAVLRRGYVDMVPLNSFYLDGTFVFYDQEFCEENYPANAIITRMIATLYAGSVELLKKLPIETLFERYNLTKKLNHFQRMEWDFLADLRNERELRKYHNACRRNGDVINSNRQRMNYSQEDYQRLFIDIFRNADTRKLILFGSGVFTQRFLALYSQDYSVYAIIDNNREKWGQELEGITIQSPDILRDLASGEYKVLICIKNYLSVMKQLDSMGVTEYSIFESGKDYPRKRKPLVPRSVEVGSDGASVEKKKYHIGYIAGVFDLFHVGHLNMFKRAKEQCDYLIVGVVTDEGVRKFKETEPFVPYEERVEMVRSCRYVDEVAEIPLNFGGTSDAWRLHHFDCQFSGSDYAAHPDWLAEKEFLEKHGAEMVFFPYTEGTSSTKLKTMIEKKLL